MCYNKSMEELMNKTDNLIKSLENTNEIKTLKEKNKLLKEQKDLLKDIEEYQKNPTEELRNKIIKNPFYREYKKCENCDLISTITYRDHIESLTPIIPAVYKEENK